MVVARFDFLYYGSIKDFNAQINNWLNSTPEGRRYNYKKPDPDFYIKLQRGIGVLTAPIVFQFKIENEEASQLGIIAIGYIKTFTLFGKSSISNGALIGAIPRRNGWADMTKLLSFLGVMKFNHGEM